jgi:ferric-dicitrate binding protein FerR (iron transport regulator)
MILQEAKQFVALFITGGYTPEEYAAFLRWLKGATVEELNAIADEHEARHESWSLTSGGPSSEWVAQLERKLDDSIGDVGDDIDNDDIGNDDIGEYEVIGEEIPVIGNRPDRKIRRNVWLAAASVIVLLSAGTYLYVEKTEAGRDEQGKRLEALTNTFSNPRGGLQKQFVLADGSKVWLNAASSLKYPTRFAGSERLVELSGEAFFEVAPSAEHPFRVLIRNAEVEVLGTGFNVKAYDDDPVSRTTLIDGAVKVGSGAESVTLGPGQQADIPYSSLRVGAGAGAGVGTAIKVLSGVDPGSVLAWRSGTFQFDNDHLDLVMRTLARAYNVDVQFEPNVPDLLVSGIFNRADGLRKILEQLESLKIHFKNDGKKVIVCTN